MGGIPSHMSIPDISRKTNQIFREPFEWVPFWTAFLACSAFCTAGFFWDGGAWPVGADAFVAVTLGAAAFFGAIA